MKVLVTATKLNTSIENMDKVIVGNKFKQCDYIVTIYVSVHLRVIGFRSLFIIYIITYVKSATITTSS